MDLDRASRRPDPEPRERLNEPGGAVGAAGSRAIVPAVTRAILHLTNDQPLAVDLIEMPSPGDIAVICTNIRTIDGKKPVYIDFATSTFVFPMLGIRFLEILNAAGEGAESAPSASATPVEPEDLEIDEDFLRRVREA